MSFVLNNPVRYNDPSGHFAWYVSGAIGAGVGGVVGGALYYAFNRNSFQSGEFWTAVGGGAVAGGLIGSGVGIFAQSATAGALTTAATAITGAGTGAAGSAFGYTVTNQDSFQTTSYVETTAVGGAVGGASSVMPLSSLGVAGKTLTYIAGSESLYTLQTDQWTVEGARDAAVAGATSAAFDVGFSYWLAASGIIPIKAKPSSNGYILPSSSADIAKVNARYNAGSAMINAAIGAPSGVGSFITSVWVVNFVK